MALCQQWCSIDDLCCDKTEYTEEQMDDAIQAASETLDRDSYHQYGVCEYTIVPGVTNGCGRPWWRSGMNSYAVSAEVISGTPIVDVTAINVFDENGDPVANDYLDQIWWEFNIIYFPSGFVFPTQTAGPVGAPNTWNIELTAGREIPALGKKAAIEFAKELLKGDCGQECALPPEVMRVMRDGGTWEMVDVKNALALLPRVSRFYQSYCRPRRWAGAVSPLNYQNQLVQ